MRIQLRRLAVLTFAVSALAAPAFAADPVTLTFWHNHPEWKDRVQAILDKFEVENPDAALSVGSLLTVLVQTGENRNGLIVPRSAVVQDASGQWIVWRHDYAEGFIATPVRTEAIDGENVLVVAGLQPDARVVVDGADLLTEIR